MLFYRKALRWNKGAVGEGLGGQCGRSVHYDFSQILSLPGTWIQMVRPTQLENRLKSRLTCPINFDASVVDYFLTWPPLCPCRLKNGQPLKDDYRFRQKSDTLVIRGVTEMDAGNYSVVLINKITKEEQRRSFQLLVNGDFSSGLSSEMKERKVFRLQIFISLSVLQCLLILSRRRWRQTPMFTPLAAAPHWGARRVVFLHPRTSNGSGCQKRTVQRPSSKSPHRASCPFLSVAHFQQAVDAGALLSWCWQKQERRQWKHTVTWCGSEDVIHMLTMPVLYSQNVCFFFLFWLNGLTGCWFTIQDGSSLQVLCTQPKSPQERTPICLLILRWHRWVGDSALLPLSFQLHPAESANSFPLLCIFFQENHQLYSGGIEERKKKKRKHDCLT